MSYRIRRSRWYLKKAARKGLALSAWSCGRLAETGGGPDGAGHRVRAITYHRFGDRPFDPFCVSRRRFEAQMRLLADRRLAVSLDDVEAFVAGEKDLPEGSVLVTVDDGFRSVLTEMLPVLRHYAIPAVAYDSPGLIAADEGREGRPPPDCPPEGDLPEPYLTWPELRRLAAAGVVIGSHGLTHRSLGRMGPPAIRDEALRSRQVLEEWLGCPVSSFAYPYGTQADFSPTSANILAEVGYTTAFTSQHGPIRAGADPLELPRVKVEGGERLWMFRLLCRGAMDGWRLVDRTLWRLQAAR